MKKKHRNPNIPESFTYPTFNSAIDPEPESYNEYKLLDFSYEPINYENAASMKKINDFKGIILSADPTGISKGFIYSDSLIKEYVSDIQVSLEVPNKKSVLISALMRNPRAQRVELYKTLEQSGLLEDNLVSFNSTNMELSDERISKEDKEKYTGVSKVIDIHDRSPCHGYHGGYFEPDCSIAYYDIVTETHFFEWGMFVTEKSFKFAAHGSVPVFIGQPGLVAYMRSIGLDVFDDIIDHSYDDISNHRVRLKAVLSEIPKLSKYNEHDLLDRFVSNKQRLLDLVKCDRVRKILSDY